MADGFKKPGKPESAYYFGAALATYTKNGNRWVVGAEYFNKEYEYKNVTVPVSRKPVYGRRRVLYQNPFRPPENLLSVLRVVGSCRIRNKQLGR